MFHYKVFRQRFLFVSVGILTLMLLLLVVAYAFFAVEWVNATHAQANVLFQRAESSMQANERLVDLQLNRIYGDRELTTDTRTFCNSQNTHEYIQTRIQNSLRTQQLIRSFPEDLRMYLSRHADAFRQIDTFAQNHLNRVSIRQNEAVLEFDLRAFDGEPAHASPGLLFVRRTVYDPNVDYLRISEVRFGFDASYVFRTDAGYRMTAAYDLHNKRLLYATSRDARDAALLQRILQAEQAGGTLLEGFNRVFYTRFTSQRYGYHLVVFVDDAYLLREHGAAVLFAAAVLGLIALCFLLIIYTNLRYDARFLDRILSVITAVKQGDYTAEPEGEYRRNEYGLIARELDGMSAELQRQIVRGYQLTIRQQEAEMKALQSQINPHFLYNTLEAIRSRLLVGGDRSGGEAIADLGALYRDIVKKQDVIALEDELHILEKYLRIMAFRYPDNFLYQIDMPPELLQRPTVKFWMQPIAENFFKHGFSQESPYNLLLLRGEAEARGFRIQFIDNGSGVPEARLEALREELHSDRADAPGKSVGLSNVYMRLSRFYGAGFSMQLENNPEGGMCVTLHIPWEDEHVHATDR